MAGGKETPRQKMVNLMYLVLLALLALQVSGAIIQKFVILNRSLETTVGMADKRNDKVLSQMELKVETNKNRPGDVKVLGEAKALRIKTKDLLDYLASVKADLIEQTGGLDESGFPIGAKEEEPVMQVMLGSGDRKDGEAYKMKANLDAYMKFVKEAGVAYDFTRDIALAPNGDEDPLFADDPEQKGKDFAHLNFESTPMVAALATISEKESRVLQVESDLLRIMGGKIGGEIIPIDGVMPVVRSNASTVVAGTDYEAEMFMAAMSSSFKPEMTLGNKGLDVDGLGRGKVKFKVSGGAYDKNGVLKKTWKGTIKYPKADGTDSLYTIEQEYYVVKPAIEVKSASLQALYKDCGNTLTFSVPALGSAYKPKFNVTGGSSIRGSDRGQITIIPSSPEVKVAVNSDGTSIGTKTFKVRLVPKATVVTGLDLKRGVAPSTLRNINVKAAAPDDFAELLPRDSHFKITKMTVTLARGKSPVLPSKTVNSGKIRLPEFAIKAKTGDRLLIEIEEVKRKNFRGEKVNAKVDTKFINVPII